MASGLPGSGAGGRSAGQPSGCRGASYVVVVPAATLASTAQGASVLGRTPAGVSGSSPGRRRTCADEDLLFGHGLGSRRMAMVAPVTGPRCRVRGVDDGAHGVR